MKTCLSYFAILGIKYLLNNLKSCFSNEVYFLPLRNTCFQLIPPQEPSLRFTAVASELAVLYIADGVCASVCLCAVLGLRGSNMCCWKHIHILGVDLVTLIHLCGLRTWPSSQPHFPRMTLLQLFPVLSYIGTMKVQKLPESICKLYPQWVEHLKVPAKLGFSQLQLSALSS